VTGGTLDNASEVAPDSELATTLTGRSSRGRLRPGSGHSRRIGPGDIVVLPPNTPHVFTEVDESGIVYTVVRVDPHFVLPKDYVNAAIK
jgi:quercetin dioxygenase-like cupin family protein